MASDSADQFQFASDFDGDLHLFPKNLDEPDYQTRWRVWILHSDGSRSEAPLCSPMMCVNDGIVTNPHYTTGHREVAGWYVDSLNASEIEVSIDSGPVIRLRHPRPG
jgi:hypothetical protein